MNEFLHRVYWGNMVLDYLIAAGSILLSWIILKLIRKWVIVFLKKLSKRTATNFDDILVRAVDKFVIPYVYLIINYNIINQLNLSLKVEKVLDVAIIVVTVYFIARLINFMIHGAVLLYMEQKNEPPERIKQLNGILIVVKVLVWGMGILMLIDNLGYDVTTIVAGLGVGGIAIALAAQNILSDLFSYFVIFFDKPFEIGDFIIVGDNAGTVERIGIKTSHVRSIDGEQLIMPNAELVKEVIRNFKRLQRRRIVFSIGAVYYTPAEKLKLIPGILKEIIDKQENATFDRAHLKSFGDFSINYEIVYYVESPDYLVYMNTHHAISISVFEKFEKEKIEFAFPTQTLFVNKQEIAAEIIND
jgi:small-conductance mechanosensitive channel